MERETLKQDNKKFIVEIERTEKYYHKVIVMANDKNDAQEKVKAFDRMPYNGFENEWNELQPDVSTRYTALTPEEADLVDGEEDRLSTVNM